MMPPFHHPPFNALWYKMKYKIDKILKRFFNNYLNINPLPHGRQTLPTPQRQVTLDKEKDDCSGLLLLAAVKCP